MALQSIAQVAISLQSGGVSRAGFGTPIFLTAHNYYTDRVRSYSDVTSVGADTQLTSNAYKAAVSAFSNEPSVSTLKIGRLIASSEISPEVTDSSGSLVVGVTVSLTVTDQNDASVTATYTTLGGDTVADVVDVLVAAINLGGLDVTLTDNGDTFTIARTTPYASGGDFVLSGLTNIGVTAVNDGNAETGVEGLTAIRLVDDDFYAVHWENHTDRVEILNLADTIEALDKIYFVGSAATSTITDPFTLGTTPTSLDDILGYLADGGYARTIGWWHQDADTDFNELAFSGYNLPFDAGSVTWANIQVPVTNAKNASGNKLTSTEEQNLSDRYANWASIKGGVVYNREGKVIGNEWIDVIRGRDNLKSDLEADIFDLLTNQQGSKIPYTNKGINQVAGIVETRLNYYKVNREFLTDPITISVPKAQNVLAADKVNRILNDMTFKATLAGAIQLVDLQGTLTI